MAGGNFDNILAIQTGDTLAPAGTLGDFGTRPVTTRIHLHFWVVQMQPGSKGAFIQYKGKRVGDTDRWVMAPVEDHDHIHFHGAFTPGPAFATAVAILDDGTMDWWSENIQLGPIGSDGTS